MEEIHPFSQFTDVDDRAFGGYERFHQAAVERVDMGHATVLEVFDDELVASGVGD